MILLTVGTQLPFDRLVAAVDKWAGLNSVPVVGQIGPTDYVPKSIKFARFFGQSEMDELVASSSLLISHAGMGSILTALMSAKPIIVVPRRADLGEHRNNHQMATVRRLSSFELVQPVIDLEDLNAAIQRLIAAPTTQAIPSVAPPDFTARLRALIDA